MPMPDLTQPVTFRGTDLNTFSEALTDDQHTISGTQVDSLDVSEVDLRQFTEGLALANGIDVGGVWLGARHITIHATSYGASRGAAYDVLNTLEPLFLPDSGTFGFYDFVFYTNSAGGPVPVTLQARPGGMRFLAEKSKHGGALLITDDVPLAISWTCRFFCKNPSFS